MKNRDTTVICWELLKAMAQGPRIPSSLSRTANVPYGRLGEYLGLLTSAGLVKSEPAEGHETYSITPRGMEVLNYLDSGLRMLFTALE
ncbi:MAG TPA: winged helix-turn-helix domain-containing protein [Nitrososphaerales archaeon]|nr:winged helix-turn-helix domain-containing protein [Nitrososphaerales archaeon]